MIDGLIQGACEVVAGWFAPDLSRKALPAGKFACALPATSGDGWVGGFAELVGGELRFGPGIPTDTLVTRRLTVTAVEPTGEPGPSLMGPTTVLKVWTPEGSTFLAVPPTVREALLPAT